MSNLQLRIISAVILAAAVLALTYAGGIAFRVLAAAIAAGVFYEWCTIARKASDSRQQLAGAVLLALALLAMILQYDPSTILIYLAFSSLLVMVWGAVSGDGYWTAGALAYAGLSGLSLGWLRGADHAGLVAILFLFAVVWATDICAYFVGRTLGGPKLAPLISPGKTQSGAIGGSVGGVLAGMGLAACAGLGNLPVLALVAFVLSIVSQAGDLFESWIKRRHGVKDSGALIPGHGGVFDRVDGLVAAAFVLYALGALLSGAGNPAQSLFAN